MENIDSLIDDWEVLIEDICVSHFDDNAESFLDFDENLFKETVRSSFYHFKEVIKSQKIIEAQSEEKCMLTSKEKLLLSRINAFANQKKFHFNKLGYALQFICGMLYDYIIFFGFHDDSILSITEIRKYPNGEEKSFEIRYNVDKGNLQDVIDNL